jgi:hypothetical protein
MTSVGWRSPPSSLLRTRVCWPEAEEKNIDLLGREEEIFGVDHLEAGKWLAEQWKRFSDVAAYHRADPCPERPPLL